MNDGGSRWAAEDVFDHLATPSLVINELCTIVAANLAAASLLDVKQSELVGTQLVERWRPQDHERLHRAANGLFLTPGRRTVIEWVGLVGVDDEWSLVTVAMTSLETTLEPMILCEVIPPIASGQPASR